VKSLIVLDFSNAFFSSTANNKIYQIRGEFTTSGMHNVCSN
jgi:hypothetical protein